MWWFRTRCFCGWSFWCEVYWQIGVVKCLIGVSGMMQVPSSYSKNNSRNTWLLASNFAPPTSSSNTLAKQCSSTLEQFWVNCLLPLFRKWGAYAFKEVVWQQQHSPWFNARSWCYEKWLLHLERAILSMTQKSWGWSKASWQVKLQLCTPLYHLSQWLDLIHICSILNLPPVRPICPCRFACVFLRGHRTSGWRGKQICII